MPEPRLALSQLWTQKSTWAQGLVRLSRCLLFACALLPLIGHVTESAVARVDRQRLIDADREPGNWMAHGRTYDEQRFSPLDQINTKTVARLGLAWHARLDIDHGTEATPLMIDGVLYTTGARSIVYAFDARNGRLLWKYDPKVPGERLSKGCCDIVNRGVAAWQGRIYVASFDGRLIALDARRGKRIWEVQTVDLQRSYTVTGAPRIVNGKVIIGNGGAELGVRGYVTAYAADSGRQLWRFYTVPAGAGTAGDDPVTKLMAATWAGGEAWEFGGGGTVWDSMAYDPQLNLLYIGVGNASPWNRYVRNPGKGDNLFLSSIVALNADTGRYVWHYQTTPNEGWDYTATQHLILAELTIDRAQVPVIMQAPKNGFFYVLDRRNGKLISAQPYSKVTWASRIDPVSGRPVENPEVADYSQEPKLTWPGPSGAHNWNPMAYSPQTGLVYIPEQEAPFIYVNNPAAKFNQRGWNTGVTLPQAPEAPADVAQMLQLFKGSLLAWDPVRQVAKWKVPYASPGNGGVLATAGRLVFQGTADGRFVAYAADSGEKLWETPVQTGIVAAPIAYAVDGEQYIALMAGWGGGFPRFAGQIAAQNQVHTISRLLVFKLGGSQVLPPLPPQAAVEPPPAAVADTETIARGRGLFNEHCSMCHGAAAVSGGSVPDLRRMSTATRNAFVGIVLGGARIQGGMPNFRDLLSLPDVETINAYLIQRAHDERAEAH